MDNSFLTIANLLGAKTPHPQTGQPCKQVLVATHTMPDGDAIGSSFACAHIACQFGANVRLLFPDGRPEAFAFLCPPCPVVNTLEELGDFVPDLVCILDCGDAKRPGATLAEFLQGTHTPAPGWENAITVNVDHHIGNPLFATHNWVNPAKAATSEMVGDIAEHLGLALQGDLGQAVYLGLMTDTGKFSFPNTTAHTMYMAARIVEAGLNVADFTANHDNTWSLGRMRLWGELMHSITLHHEGRIASCLVWQEQFSKCGATKDDLEGFAAQLRCIKGVEVAVFMRQDAPEKSKVSLRSVAARNIRDVAAFFGGGGHKNAAGAEFTLPPDKAMEQVVQKLIKTWDQSAL